VAHVRSVLERLNLARPELASDRQEQAAVNDLLVHDREKLSALTQQAFERDLSRSVFRCNPSTLQAFDAHVADHIEAEKKLLAQSREFDQLLDKNRQPGVAFLRQKCFARMTIPVMPAKMSAELEELYLLCVCTFLGKPDELQRLQAACGDRRARAAPASKLSHKQRRAVAQEICAAAGSYDDVRAKLVSALSAGTELPSLDDEICRRAHSKAQHAATKLAAEAAREEDKQEKRASHVRRLCARTNRPLEENLNDARSKYKATNQEVADCAVTYAAAVAASAAKKLTSKTQRRKTALEVCAGAATDSYEVVLARLAAKLPAMTAEDESYCSTLHSKALQTLKKAQTKEANRPRTIKRLCSKTSRSLQETVAELTKLEPSQQELRECETLYAAAAAKKTKEKPAYKHVLGGPAPMHPPATVPARPRQSVDRVRTLRLALARLHAAAHEARGRGGDRF
jgi:hypothetical protein